MNHCPVFQKCKTILVVEAVRKTAFCICFVSNSSPSTAPLRDSMANTAYTSYTAFIDTYNSYIAYSNGPRGLGDKTEL